MQRITSQSSIQAAELIKQVSKDPETMLVVSSSGNVRHANRLQRIIYGVVDFFDMDAAKQRITKARQAVREKLCTELTALGQSESTYLAPMIDSAVNTLISDHQPETSPASHSQIQSEVDTLSSNSEIKSSFDSPSQIEAKFKTALVHIREITNESASVPLNLLWQVVEEQRTKYMPVNIQAASTIAANTSLWKKSLGISTQDAFRLASNAWKLHETKKIPPEEGKEILLCSGRLINRHGFTHEDALNHAIDLWVPMKELNVRMDSIERAMKSLDYAIPKLREQPERIRISAAIRYLQLLPKTLIGTSPIDVIRQNLADLPLVQQGMPAGCIIDQIHQGSHLRGKASLTRAHCQELEQKIATLTEEDLYSKSSNGRHGVNFPDIFNNFDQQHVIDLTRGLKIELRTNDSIDQSFANLENKRRQNPKSLSEQEFQQWAELRTSWAGSSEAARSISHLQSQTFFGEVELAAGNNLRNESGYMCKEMGDPELLWTSYAANRTTRDTREVFELSAVRYVNAPRLVAEPDAEQQDELLPKPQLNFPLLPNPGEGIQANPTAFSVKRECVLEADASDLAKGSTQCRVIAVTEEWDILFDWDTWIKNRTSIGTL